MMPRANPDYDDVPTLDDDGEPTYTDFSRNDDGDISLGERLGETTDDLTRLSDEVLALEEDIESAWVAGQLDDDLFEALTALIRTAQEVAS